MHLHKVEHKVEFDYGFFGLGCGWHCVKCGKVYGKKPLLTILINKLLKL